MIARVATFAFTGMDPQPVEVQVQISAGMPAFTLVGLGDKAVGESRERVRAALASLCLSLPPRRVLVNLAPADLAKEGSHYDLPIALALLAAMDLYPIEDLARFAALGELALDGALLPVPGVLPAAMAAAGRDLGLICPASQGGEAAWAGPVEVLAPVSLAALLAHIRGTQILVAPRPSPPLDRAADPLCLSQVKGQETAKRALEVAAVGGHNLLLVGPPGAGKSKLAQRMPGLLPDLLPEQALEASIVHSVAGMLREGRLLRRPPFRQPHHSASMAALAGGGPRARPGEISLAHHGVLFLDEWPEFPRPALEALRQPMESGEAVISRATARTVWPARFQLVAAMNPCRCGMLGDAARECPRAPGCGAEYTQRLSGPLLDRMDLAVEVQPVPPAELARAPSGERSAAVAMRVAAARDLGLARWQGAATNATADHDALRAGFDAPAAMLVEQAAEKLGLSARGQVRTMRVARTIADLAGAALVGRAHVAEALAYRLRSWRR